MVIIVMLQRKGLNKTCYTKENIYNKYEILLFQ
jgi:hypothetical protein